MDAAAEIMNRRGAIEVEELIGREPNTGNVTGKTSLPDAMIVPNRADPPSGQRRPLVCVVARQGSSSEHNRRRHLAKASGGNRKSITKAFASPENSATVKGEKSCIKTC